MAFVKGSSSASHTLRVASNDGARATRGADWGGLRVIRDLRAEVYSGIAKDEIGNRLFATVEELQKAKGMERR